MYTLSNSYRTKYKWKIISENMLVIYSNKLDYVSKMLSDSQTRKVAC